MSMRPRKIMGVGSCDDFDKGVACCTAWLIKAHDKNSIALEMLHEMGITLKGCDDFDAKAIKKAVRGDRRYKIKDGKLLRV